MKDKICQEKESHDLFTKCPQNIQLTQCLPFLIVATFLDDVWAALRRSQW